MKIIVDDVKAIVVDRDDIVAGSVGIHEVGFHFDQSWNGYNKTAVFKSGDECFEVGIGNVNINACPIPWQAIKASGDLQIGVRGQADGKMRPTLWSEAIPIHEGATGGVVIKNYGGVPVPDNPNMVETMTVRIDANAVSIVIYYAEYTDGEIKLTSKESYGQVTLDNVVKEIPIYIHTPDGWNYCESDQFSFSAMPGWTRWTLTDQNADYYSIYFE